MSPDHDGILIYWKISDLSDKVGFVDYSRVLKHEKYLTSLHTYTATEDCIAYAMVRKENNSAPTVNNVSLNFAYGIYTETYTIPLKVGDVLRVPASSANNSSIIVYAVR